MQPQVSVQILSRSHIQVWHISDGKQGTSSKNTQSTLFTKHAVQSRQALQGPMHPSLLESLTSCTHSQSHLDSALCVIHKRTLPPHVAAVQAVGTHIALHHEALLCAPTTFLLSSRPARGVVCAACMCVSLKCTESGCTSQ